MNKDGQASFMFGAMFGIGIVMGILGLYLTFFPPVYDRCATDEVWAWQMDYRPDAENREWECVAISDLKEVGK